MITERLVKAVAGGQGRIRSYGSEREEGRRGGGGKTKSGVNRCYELVNAGNAVFPILTNEHERKDTCGMQRGHRGRGKGRGSPGEGGRASRNPTPQGPERPAAAPGRGRGAMRNLFQVHDVLNAVGQVGRSVRPRTDAGDTRAMEE